MPALSSYDYSIVRVVPRVERGEFVNAGAILFCRVRRYLAARIELDEARLLALAPDLDLADVRLQLAAIPIICEGGVAAGPIGALPLADRFHWLVAPRSAVVQPSPVHSGLCADPAAALDDLVDRLVRAPRPDRDPALDSSAQPQR